MAAEKGISEEQARQLLNNKKQLEFEREQIKLKHKEAKDAFHDENKPSLQERIDSNPNINKENYQNMLKKHGRELDVKMAFNDTATDKEMDAKLESDLSKNSAALNGGNANVELEYN